MLNFYHAEQPGVDFVIFACHPSFFIPLKHESIRNLAIDLGIEFKEQAKYKDIAVYSLSRKSEEGPSSYGVFSGYLQHNGALHFGNTEIEKSGISSEELLLADGYFTYAQFCQNATVVSQDSFGRDIIFHYITDECVVASNRCHLLLLFLSSLGIKPAINYDTVLSIMCSDTQFYQQQISRHMLFKGIQQMPMTEYIEITEAGWTIKNKKLLERIFYPAESPEYLFEKGLHEICTNTDAIFSRQFSDGIKVDVTGGYDSRITVAALMKLGHSNFECRTTANVNSNGDVLIGSLMAQKFGLNQGDNLFYPRMVWDSYENALDFQRSTLMGVTYTPSFGSSRVASEANCFLVTGDWAEIYKPYFTKAYLPDFLHEDISLDELANAYIQKNSFLYNNNSQLQKRLLDVFRDEIALLPGEKAQEKFNNHLPFYRMRSHFGASVFQKQYCNCRWAPASSQSMWAYCNAVSYNERYKKHPYDLSIRIANALCQEMEGIPYAAPGETPKLELYGTDVTANFSIDRSNWDAIQKESKEKNSAWYADAVKQKGRTVDEHAAAWQNRASQIVPRAFWLLERLAEYSSEMAEIFNDTLRAWLREHAEHPYILPRYYIKLQNIWDQMAAMNLLDDMDADFFLPTPAEPTLSTLPPAIFDMIPVVALIHNPVEFSNDLIANGILTLPNGKRISAKPYSTLFQQVFDDSPEENLLFIKGLDWLEALLRAYDETHESQYKNECLEAIQAFFLYLGSDIESQLKLPSSVEHGYATRSFVLSRVLQAGYDIAELKPKIFSLLAQHAEWLSDLKNRRLNNHDVMTNRALLHLSLLMSEDARSPLWRRTALERLEELFSLNFDTDGMTNENTPSYHQFNINLFAEVCDYIEHYGIECRLTQKAKPVLEKARNCMRHLVRQDSSCPAIGDSSTYKTPYESINKSCYYSQSGFCIIKDDDLYLSFKCGFGLESHKHHDETSITLFYKGIDLVMDGGRFNYDKQSPIRQHMVSPKAHSAIYPTSLDDCNIRRVTGKYKEAGLFSFAENDSFATVTGGYTLLDGTCVTRHLCRIQNWCQITDTWDNATPQDMRQRFVLAPGAQLLTQTSSQKGVTYSFIKNGILFEIDIYVPHGVFENQIVSGIISPVTHETVDVLCLDTLQKASEKAQIITQLRFSEYSKNNMITKRYFS